MCIYQIDALVESICLFVYKGHLKSRQSVFLPCIAIARCCSSRATSGVLRALDVHLHEAEHFRSAQIALRARKTQPLPAAVTCRQAASAMQGTTGQTRVHATCAPPTRTRRSWAQRIAWRVRITQCLSVEATPQRAVSATRGTTDRAEGPAPCVPRTNTRLRTAARLARRVHSTCLKKACKVKQPGTKH
jgi:hypothetical protein